MNQMLVGFYLYAWWCIQEYAVWLHLTFHRDVRVADHKPIHTAQGSLVQVSPRLCWADFESSQLGCGQLLTPPTCKMSFQQILQEIVSWVLMQSENLTY